MLDPEEFLNVARLLCAQDNPTDAHLRRAVSTAYYALFHKVSQAAAQRFMGAGKESTAGYRLLYRGFDHGKMKRVCEGLDVPTLKDRYKNILGRGAVSQAIRDFARAFPALQQGRHWADYHPSVEFSPPEVSGLIDAADLAMKAFDSAQADEKADVLALLLVEARD